MSAPPRFRRIRRPTLQPLSYGGGHTKSFSFLAKISKKLYEEAVNELGLSFNINVIFVSRKFKK